MIQPGQILKRSERRDIFLLLATLLALELLFLLFYRQVNLDEGWYLWASKLVYEGKRLYQDFAFTQTPLLPYVYGLWLKAAGEGLYQGRVLTLLLTLGSVLFSVITALRLVGATLGAFCLAFFVASFFVLGQFSYTATYALAACLVAAALLISTTAWPEAVRNSAAAAAIALAVGVRLSVIVALPCFLLYLLATSRQRRSALLWIGAVSTLTLFLVIGLYWLQSSELMRYDIFGFHTDRILTWARRLSKMRLIAARTGVDFAVPLLLMTVGGLRNVVICWQERARLAHREMRRPLLLVAICAMSLALFAIHLVPRTTDSYYNALQMPMMGLASVLVFSPASFSRSKQWLLLGLLLVHALLQGRASWRDGLLVYPLRNQVAITQQAATFLRQYTQPQETLLTFDLHLALEAALPHVPTGYEMSIFAYRPTFSDQQAAKYHVVNNQRLARDLQQGVSAVALSAFTLEQLYGERAHIFALLQQHYRWMKSVEGFDPYGNRLNIYLPAQFGQPKPQVTQKAQFANQIQLLGYDLSQRQVHGQLVVDVALYWRAIAQPARSYTVFTQLLNAENRWITGQDNPPCQATCPTQSWQAGEWLRDEYSLVLPSEASSGPLAGPYTLLVGMYDSVNGERVGLLDAAGKTLGDSLQLTQVIAE